MRKVKFKVVASKNIGTGVETDIPAIKGEGINYDAEIDQLADEIESLNNTKANQAEVTEISEELSLTKADLNELKGDFTKGVQEVTVTTQGVVNIEIPKAKRVFVEVTIPANASCSAGAIFFNSEKTWQSGKAIYQFNSPAVATATYARIATFRLYDYCGYWWFEYTEFGGATNPYLRTLGYNNYFQKSLSDFPYLQSILLNISDLPIGTKIKIWSC